VLGVVRDLRSPRSLASPEEAAAYAEHLLAEYVLARLAHGVAWLLSETGVPDPQTR